MGVRKEGRGEGLGEGGGRQGGKLLLSSPMVPAPLEVCKVCLEEGKPHNRPSPELLLDESGVARGGWGG